MTNGYNSESTQRDHDRNNRRNQIRRFLGLGWYNLLFESHFDGVGQGLKDARRSNAVRPQASLHLGNYAPLDQRHIGKGGQESKNDDSAFNHAGDDFVIEKIKHASPPVPACGPPVCPVLPSLSPHRGDYSRQFLRESPENWYSSTYGPYACLFQAEFPNRS